MLKFGITDQDLLEVYCYALRKEPSKKRIRIVIETPIPRAELFMIAVTEFMIDESVHIINMTPAQLHDFLYAGKDCGFSSIFRHPPCSVAKTGIKHNSNGELFSNLL